MKLTKLILNNYRSFGPTETIIRISDLTAFIGQNSSGKTTILSALLKLFGNTRINKSDFHIPLDKSPDEIEESEFYLEAYFEFNSKDNVDLEDEYGVAHYFENFIVDEPGGNPHIVIRLEAKYEKGNSPEGIIDYNFYYVVENDENSLKPISVYDRDKIQVIYIPAIRDPNEQLKNATGTILWRILNRINWKDSDKDKVNSKIDELDKEVANQNGITVLKEMISSQWKNYHSDIRYKEANIKFGSSDLDNILKKLEVEFTPSHTEKAYKVNDLGEGLRSLFYLTLIDSLLGLENRAILEIESDVPVDERILNIDPPALTLILVEEPENHVSPHLLGKIIKNLNNIRGRQNSQVLITSHSPSIVKRIEPSEVRHLRIENGTSIVNEIILPDKKDESYKYVKEAVKAYPELYFSSLVILGEGDSEEVILPKFINLYLNDLDSTNISIAPLGGRHVNHFWRLLNQLNIPFITLLDLDRERYGGGWGRIKYVLNELIKNGKEKEGLFTLENGMKITEAEFNIMQNREDYNGIEEWIEKLEEYNVYFSTPLDIDFLMIENFTDYYLAILDKNEGPLIKVNERSKMKRVQDLTEDEKKTEFYKSRIESDINNVLKKNGGKGETYTNMQKELMIWYNYFFLNRGKPITHLIVLNMIVDETLIEKNPIVFKNMIDKINSILNIEV